VPTVGASVQGEDQLKKEKRDCRRMGDTLNHSIDPIVIRWFFGNNAPILAETFVEYPDSEDTSELRESVTALVNAGAEVPIEPVAKRLNVPLAKKGEKTFEKAVKPAPLSGGDGPPSGRKPAINVARSGDPDLEKFLGPHRDDFLKAFANDLQPLRTAMEAVLSPDDVSFNSKVTWLRSQLPSLLKEIARQPASADDLAKLLRDAFTHGYTQRSTAELASTAK
jgi:phage gp29-like protein